MAAKLGYPVVIRPAYTMGGTGGGLVYNPEELRVVAARGLAASLVGQILVEESVLGWEELELEVVRDAKNQMITVCFIENVDAMGVHTGDSYCTAPMLTISPELQKRLQKYSYDIVEAIQVIGGTNVQFAHDPKTGRVVVIEINPRTSRSSALASKATGFPIALISAMLAGGLTLDEIPYWREGTLEKYTPWGDYVVVKFARWDFEKFPGAEDKLGTQMRAVGEVMSIGKNYKEALQKSIRSLEKGRYGLGFARDYNQKSLEELMDLLVGALERAPVHHVRGPEKRGRRGCALPQDLHQALVHRTDEGTRRTRGKDSENQRQRPARQAPRSRPRRTALPTATSPRSWAYPRRKSESAAPAWVSSSAGTPCPSPVSRTPPTITPPTTPPTRSRRRTTEK